jgi:GNAT acetyltransferase-like protein
MKIELLEEDRFNAYERFLLQNKGTLLYVSNNYRKLLKDFLKAEDYYFLAIGNDNEIKGALPAFLKQNDDHGNILNSLPFYGSNGGIIEYEGNDEVKKLLLSAFDSFAQERKCAATTIITSPFENDIGFYEKEIDFGFQDKRLGQLTKLPNASNDVGSEIMNMIDGVRRRNIRKALKSNIEIKDGNDLDIIDFLAKTHEENIGAVGGSIKPKFFFELIKNNFEYHENYRIYVAYLDAIPIAALLLFYYNKTVEYFTPVVLEEFRTYQPLSLIIFEAMKDSVEMGYEWWN